MSEKADIGQVRNFFEDLLNEGIDLIKSRPVPKASESEEKRTFESGVKDYITKTDLAVRDLYVSRTKQMFPQLTVIVEDGKEKLTKEELEKVGAIAIYDPVDGTALLKEGKLGYGTMASLAVRVEGGFTPVLGAFRKGDGDKVISAIDYNGEKRLYNITPAKKEKKSLEQLVVSRTPIERKKLLGPICDALGIKVKRLRGMGTHAEALVKGESDIVIYEPGVGYNDVLPIIPIITAAGGEVTDLRGKPIVYDGTSKSLEHGFLATSQNVSKEQREQILERISKVYR